VSAPQSSGAVEAAAAGSPPPHKMMEDRFYLIALIFQRARQLQNGARPRVYKDGHKPTRLAQLEVMAGLVSWELGPEPVRPVIAV
jgi:DNA-directed RNA polymerase subunit K/omega